MLALDGKTAGPSWLKFLRKHIGTIEVTKTKQKFTGNYSLLNIYFKRLMYFKNNKKMKKVENRKAKILVLSRLKSFIGSKIYK